MASSCCAPRTRCASRSCTPHRTTRSCSRTSAAAAPTGNPGSAPAARSHTSDAFGLERDGWCGDSPQRNAQTTDGWRFFAECRLLPQGQRAYEAGRLEPRDMAKLERLCLALPARIPEQPASLVHGDLWTGNLHACADGELALIDAAAVHYGWAEADLAMLTLFGEPPAAFFAAYEGAAAIDSSWRSRAAIYNLYHLLNHLNLFGSSYRSSVRAVLRSA
jgi:protein-ribulosamine 3-kinase